MNKLRAYNILFQTRSETTSSALELLNKQAIHPQASVGYVKAWKLVEILSSFLIRYPDHAKTYPYVSSAPFSCTNWPSFRQRILAAK